MPPDISGKFILCISFFKITPQNAILSLQIIAILQTPRGKKLSFKLSPIHTFIKLIFKKPPELFTIFFMSHNRMEKQGKQLNVLHA